MSEKGQYKQVSLIFMHESQSFSEDKSDAASSSISANLTCVSEKRMYIKTVTGLIHSLFYSKYLTKHQVERTTQVNPGRVLCPSHSCTSWYIPITVKEVFFLFFMPSIMEYIVESLRTNCKGFPQKLLPLVKKEWKKRGDRKHISRVMLL